MDAENDGGCDRLRGVFDLHSGFAQTGGLTGKCTGQGGAPLAGYTLQVERTEMKWSSKVKTNKKGEYTYIGLAPGQYKITLLGPDGKPMYFIEKKVGIGDPTEVNFDMGQVSQGSQESSRRPTPSIRSRWQNKSKARV